MAIRNKLNIYTLIVLLSFINYRISANSFDIPESIKIRKDLVRNTITLYLQKGSTVEDSLQLIGANFAVDSLITINKSTWHYIYSVRCGSNCKLRYQIIFRENNKKIHLSYVGYYQMSFGFDQLYASDTSLRAKDVMEYSDYVCKYRFSKGFFLDKSQIAEYVYKGKTPDDNSRGITSTFILKYDARKKIYYNGQKKLLGNYEIIEGRSQKTKFLSVDVLILKFRESEWIYLENIWYEWNEKHNALIKFNS